MEVILVEHLAGLLNNRHRGTWRVVARRLALRYAAPDT
jgi:hypothetical protein